MRWHVHARPGPAPSACSCCVQSCNSAISPAHLLSPGAVTAVPLLAPATAKKQQLQWMLLPPTATSQLGVCLRDQDVHSPASSLAYKGISVQPSLQT
ncbi:hypothetical protein ABBQ38_006735 [Trebouxia sp. C0009 RCD-2024]